MLKTGFSRAERKPARSCEDFDCRQLRSPRKVVSFACSHVDFSDIHSQITKTLQPDRARRARVDLSRATFSSNFLLQNRTRVFGVRVRKQPTWRCQKHPCTNIALRRALKTISGRPGTSFGCNR